MISNPDDLEHKQQQAWEDRAEESGSDEGEDDDDGDFEAGDEGEEEVSSSCQCRQQVPSAAGVLACGPDAPPSGPSPHAVAAPPASHQHAGLMQASILLKCPWVLTGSDASSVSALYTVAAGRR